ncbi:MAG: Xaa-Pro peptidase family protein [Candidatus Onthovivens sp.]|nr:Xaa-Pro peptidase family protein [Candidatus Onthovivens sp.]
MIAVNEFKERRRKLLEKMEDFSVAVIFAGASKIKSEDETCPYLANRNFYYLTNIEQENSILILLKGCGNTKEYLFVSEYDEVKEKWYGKRLTSFEATKLSGIDNVLYLSSFDSMFGMILDDRNSAFSNVNNVYLDFSKEQKIRENLFIETYISNLKLNYDNKNFIDIYPLIVRLRMVKSKQEIEEMKEAIAKTNVGLREIMKSLKEDTYEYKYSSLFYYTIQDYDYSPLSFPTICASGVNATCLHYPTPLAKTKKNDLILLDLGAKNNGYCADISRTYPISGTFSELQKIIYSIVLGCNKMVIETIKPGITIKELNNLVIDYLATHCLKANLIKNKEDIRNYYFHNISHHIGLDTHDCSFRDLPLEPGNIISDEPGLYFKELGIGVRIEDDILVTEEGSYNLSGNIIKEISEIEKFISRNKK